MEIVVEYLVKRLCASFRSTDLSGDRMASSSPSDKSNATSKLQNSYFFYGTHPLKVPNILVHANSSTALSTDQNTHHLSLNLATNHLRHGGSPSTDLVTTKSLNNLVESRTDDTSNDAEVKPTRSVHVLFSHRYVIVQMISLSVSTSTYAVVSLSYVFDELTSFVKLNS